MRSARTPKSRSRVAKRGPRGRQDGPRRLQAASGEPPELQKPLFLYGFIEIGFWLPRGAQELPKKAQEAARTAQGFVEIGFWLPRAAQELPKEAQEAARTQERPAAAQGRAKRGPRAAKSYPRKRPGPPSRAQERPRGGPG